MSKPKVKRSTAPRRGLDKELARLKRASALGAAGEADRRREGRKAAAKVLVMRAAMRGTVTGRLPHGATEHYEPPAHPRYGRGDHVEFTVWGGPGQGAAVLRACVIERDGIQVLELRNIDGQLVVAPKLANVVEVEPRR